MKRFKKLVAGILAATLVMGSASAFLAEEQSGEGGGSSNFEGTVDHEVFSVELPTITATDTAFDFILDPEGLIAETNGQNHTGKTFVTASLYFANANNTYSDTTDALVVTNKSSTDVTVTLNATATVPASNSSVTFTDDATFTSDSSTSIYLALEDSNNATPAAITASGVAGKATLTATIASCTGYEIIATNGGYEYALKDDATFATYGFYLTGACNEAADWSNYDTNAEATVNVTWTVKPVSTAAATTTVNNGVNTGTYSKANGIQIPYTLAANTSISAVKIGNSTTNIANDITNTSATIQSDKIVISGLWAGLTNGSVRYVQITFNDNTPAVTLELTIQN